jgi:uncharacterized membrane protein
MPVVQARPDAPAMATEHHDPIDQLTTGDGEPSRVQRIRSSLTRRPTSAGAIVGLFLWWWSLTPTLMPRTWMTQAAVGALCAAVGYGVGTLLASVVRIVLRRRGTDVPELWRRRIRRAVPLLGLAALVLGSWTWLRWQNRQRDLFAMEHLGAASIVPMLVATSVLFVVVVGIGRIIAAGVRALLRFNRRRLPAFAAQPVTVALVVVLAVFLVRDVAAGAFVSWADQSFGLVDTSTPEGVERPTSPAVSGSPDSLVDWDDLGMQGRAFVAGSTPESTMRAAWGDATELTVPVRTYAGIRSADDVRERARLAVDDLERAGGFERDVVVVATATGTGWIDPDAAEALEVMHRGDTAIVSMQYSYLPSWIAFVTDLDRASEAGAALFTEVERRWRDLPVEARPRLLAFGLSLGSFGAEGGFAGPTAATSIGNIVARTDGALFVGATNGNPILSELVAGRDAGSPAWAPIVEDGATVRVVTRDPDQPEPSGAWEHPRVLYVNHPSDPVTHWSADWLWSPPDWMDAPQGYDVTGDGRWFPFVTWAQGVFDLMAGFGAPPGHGHDYRLDYVDAWARVAPPDGWSDPETTRIESLLHDLG